jgi:DNA-binding NtrC family response regulator
VPTKYPKKPILLVDDEAPMLEGYSFALKSVRIDNILTCQDSRQVLDLLSKNDIEAVVLDVMMPHVSGKELLSEISANFPDIPLVMLTGVDELETAVECMRSGAFDYMVKPVEKERLVGSIRRAIELRELKRENNSLRQNIFSTELKDPEAFKEIKTQSPKMESIFKYIETVAESSRPILINGDTGVGKELIARSIHGLSGRAGDMVTVNAAGLDDNMFSDTLFGHQKGAFTGADQARNGLIEQAAQGTLFLDEISDLTAASQVKLLRLLQEGEYYPLGSDRAKYSDARIIVAANRDLRALVKAGSFRKDLYYRLSGHQINIPLLSERVEDLPVLIDYFLEESASHLNKKKPTPPAELYTLLAAYHFPGNIRELKNLIYDAVSQHSGGKLSLASFRQTIAQERNDPGFAEEESELGNPFLNLKESGKDFPTLKDAENFLIQEAMKISEDNQTIAAELLGITRLTLNKRLVRSRHSKD